KNGSFSDVYGRMKWDDVAPTLTTGCTDITRGRFAHPEQNRGMTLREAARLQSFPDSYIFLGNAGQIATQIGNAVPPAMMQTIAVTLITALNNT
ncbi:DNA cytosine methyltransferase, partial [Aeromonas sp. HMWF017]